MKDIIKRWCESEQLSVEEAYKLITEYLSYTDRTPTPEELQAILYIGQSLVPIDWDKIKRGRADFSFPISIILSIDSCFAS